MTHHKHSAFGILGFLLFIACSPAFADMGPLEPGMNRQGEDFRPSGFGVLSADDCRLACDQIDQCKAMTFVKHRDRTGGVCWLKHTVPPQTPVAGMTSAQKRGSWKGEGGE